MDFYQQHRGIIDARQCDVSLSTSPIDVRPDDLPCIYGATTESIIGSLFCQELMQICTANQNKVLSLVLEGYKIYEIAEEMDRDQRNISQTLRRIRERFHRQGIYPETLR
jgi:DNA-binding CsgD family transcriptional regulator